MSAKCAVLVNSWDGYSAAWPMMEHGLRKYWPDIPFPLYWQCNHKKPPLGIPIKTDDVTTWSFMMREALIKLMSDGFDYFCFCHEDFWLVDQVRTAVLVNYLNLMQRHAIDHIQVMPTWPGMVMGGPYQYDGSLEFVSVDSMYRTANQASLWKTASYYEILKKMESLNLGSSAWDFEVSGSNMSHEMICLSVSPHEPADEWPIKYVHRHVPGWNREPIVKGEWTEDARRYCENEGIEFAGKVGSRIRGDGGK